MRVLVIGGTNFIGPHVVAELHRRGHEVTVYHRGIHEPQLPPGVRHIHSPRAGIPVLHLPASLSDPPPDTVVHMFPIGEDDTRAAVARFTGVARRIVAISSGDVYRAYGRLLGSEPGPPEPVPLHEDSPLREVLFPYRTTAAGPADWTYHYEKILVERVLGEGRLPATVLRLPAVYGPVDPYRRLRPYIKRMGDKSPAILLEADQAGWRWSHAYVEDAALAIVCAVTDERSSGQVYNVGEREVPTYTERVRRLGELMDWTGEVIALPRSEIPEHLRLPYLPSQDLIMDSSRIRTDLGYAEAVSGDVALRRTIRWEQAHPPELGDPTPEQYAAEHLATRGRT